MILGGSPNIVTADPADPAQGCELVCVLGGDGAILRGAALSRGTEAPLLGSTSDTSDSWPRRSARSSARL
jgi:NAD kinase